MTAKTDSGQAAELLIGKLQSSGILDGHDSTEILTAFIGVAAEALHRDRQLSPMNCLSVISETALKMMRYEKSTGMLKAIFARSQWRAGN
jgi:hypothetical protein